MEAKVNVTFHGQNGDLPDGINFDTDADTILEMVEEAIAHGGIPGITYQGAQPDLSGFVVDRFNPTDTAPARLFVRPKTPFG